MLVQSVKNGIMNGIRCCWFLIKVIIPVYFFITILRHTPAMDMLVNWFAPFMGLFGLSGEAALPIITGYLLDEYAVIAAMGAVELSGYSVTIVAVMALIAHSLPVEGAIVRKLGLSATFFTIHRILAAMIVGVALNFIGVVLNLW